MSDFEISLDNAISWISNWRKNIPKEPAKAHLIQKQALLDVMKLSDVVSVRAYMAIDNDGVQKLILVGVNENGQDLIDDDHVLVDKSKPCPPDCEVESQLLNL